MDLTSRPSANCCVIAVPTAADANRLAQALAQIAAMVSGAPVPEPHVTLAYYYRVTEAQAKRLGQAIANLAAQSPALALQASRLIRDPAYASSADPYALFFEVDKTPPMAVFYTWLRQLGMQRGLEVSPNDAESWLPHIKVGSAKTPVPDGVLDQIDALAPQVHFTATHVVLTFRGEGETWVTLGAYPLAD